MGSFETNSHPHNEVKTICGERRKDGYEVSGINVQTIILVFFFSLLLKKDCRKKRIGCEVALCVSIENVKGWCYMVEIEWSRVFTSRICSPNGTLEYKCSEICYSWKNKHYIYKCTKDFFHLSWKLAVNVCYFWQNVNFRGVKSSDCKVAWKKSQTLWFLIRRTFREGHRWSGVQDGAWKHPQI